MSEPPAGVATALPDLVATMAHDLKNPLAALTTNLQFLRGFMAGADRDARDALSDSIELCEVLDRLLRNLDLIAHGTKLEAPRQRIELGAVTAEALSRARPHAESVGVTLPVDAPEAGRSAIVLADRGLVLRAVENALANAIEHAPRGSRVQVTIAASEEEAFIEIQDDRPSLPAPSADARSLRDAFGRGLSLLCADIALRAGGGRLEIAGAPGACRLRLVALRPK